MHRERKQRYEYYYYCTAKTMNCPDKLALLLAVLCDKD